MHTLPERRFHFCGVVLKVSAAVVGTAVGVACLGCVGDCQFMRCSRSMITPWSYSASDPSLRLAAWTQDRSGTLAPARSALPRCPAGR